MARLGEVKMALGVAWVTTSETTWGMPAIADWAVAKALVTTASTGLDGREAADVAGCDWTSGASTNEVALGLD